jgi:hypothetical protein
MNEHLDSREAEHALDIVAGQQRRVSDAAAPPWWVWPVTFAAGFLVIWGSSAGSAANVVPWLVPVLLAAYGLILRFSPGLAERMGVGVRQHTNSVPRRARVAIMAGLACAVVLIGLGARLLEEHMGSAGLPAWAVRNRHLLMSAVLALASTVLVWAAGRVRRTWPRGRE